MAKDFELIPASIPSQTRKASSLYSDILREFEKSSLESALVRSGSRKASTLTLGLRKAIKESSSGVKVVNRAGSVYLVK